MSKRKLHYWEVNASADFFQICERDKERGGFFYHDENYKRTKYKKTALKLAKLVNKFESPVLVRAVSRTRADKVKIAIYHFDNGKLKHWYNY